MLGNRKESSGNIVKDFFAIWVNQMKVTAIHYVLKSLTNAASEFERTNQNGIFDIFGAHSTGRPSGIIDRLFSDYDPGDVNGNGHYEAPQSHIERDNSQTQNFG